MLPCLFDCLSPSSPTRDGSGQSVSNFGQHCIPPPTTRTDLSGMDPITLFSHFPLFCARSKRPGGDVPLTRAQFPQAPSHAPASILSEHARPRSPTARHRRCTCRKLRAVGSTQADRSGAPERWIRTYREEQAMPDTPLHWRTALAPSRRSEQPARRKQMNNAFPS